MLINEPGETGELEDVAAFTTPPAASVCSPSILLLNPSRVAAPMVRSDPRTRAPSERPRWSSLRRSGRKDSLRAWPRAVDAPPELKTFYAIAHHWPIARLYGSQDFLRPMGKLARDGSFERGASLLGRVF